MVSLDVGQCGVEDPGELYCHEIERRVLQPDRRDRAGDDQLVLGGGGVAVEGHPRRPGCEEGVAASAVTPEELAYIEQDGEDANATEREDRRLLGPERAADADAEEHDGDRQPPRHAERLVRPGALALPNDPTRGLVGQPRARYQCRRRRRAPGEHDPHQQEAGEECGRGDDRQLERHGNCLLTVRRGRLSAGAASMGAPRCVAQTY